MRKLTTVYWMSSQSTYGTHPSLVEIAVTVPCQIAHINCSVQWQDSDGSDSLSNIIPKVYSKSKENQVV